MKSVIIFKVSSSSDLAHLYEHLFFDTLVDFFDSQGCIMRLDYSIHGKTYKPGLVHFDISLYTRTAVNAARQIKDLSISADDPSVSVALLQLMTEYGKELQGNNKLFDDLKKLDSQKWQDLETLDTLDLSGQREQNAPLTPTDNKLAIKTLRCKLSASTNLPQDLLPLFGVVSYVVLTAMRNALASIYGYYSVDEPFEHDKSGYAYTALLYASGRHRPTLTEEIDTCKEASSQLMEAALPEKIITELTNPESHQAPLLIDELEIYNSTKTLVGRKGWKKLATKDNITQILRTSVLELKYGSHSHSAPRL